MKGLHRLSDEELLAARLCDLPIEGLGALVVDCKEVLVGELHHAGLGLVPHLWLSDEWFCPDGVPGFAVPFYLAHPRLRRLERKMMLEVEGGTRRSCLRLMRHEAGHALDNGYDLRRSKKRTELFGSSTTAYPEFYAPKPFSRKFVRYLPGGYAQSHPDEDFAETFAVWLDRGTRWRERYRGWAAMRKLEFVDELMLECAQGTPTVHEREESDALETLERSLREHYRIQRERYRVDFKEHYDEDLHRIFASAGGASAADMLRRHRRGLRAHIAAWTGVRRYTVDAVLRDWIERARETKLFVKDEEQARRDVATALTVRVMQYLQSGHYRVAV